MIISSLLESIPAYISIKNMYRNFVVPVAILAASFCILSISFFFFCFFVVVVFFFFCFFFILCTIVPYNIAILE